MVVKPYLWIAIVGGIVAFLMGGGIGANDLANAFGTTYGAKVLTLWQIVVVAAICEFGGAISLGASVTSTLASGIANPMSFTDDPYVLMYGMLCAIGAAFSWLAFATALTLPVSSTHSIAGGIMGFALVYGGGGGVIWAAKINDFPFVRGFVPIVASWFISPLLTGAVAAFVFALLRLLVLRPANSVARATYALPLIVGITFFLEGFFILFKGAANQLHWSSGKCAWIGVCIGVGAAIISIPLVPLLRYKVRRMTEEAERKAEESGEPIEKVEQEYVAGKAEVDDSAEDLHKLSPRHAAAADGPVVATEGLPLADDLQMTHETADHSSSEPFTEGDDVKKSVDSRDLAVGEVMEGSEAEVPRAKRFWEEYELPPVEIFDPRVEYVFRYLQVFTAICMSFAHGASDVSNSIGPFAAIYSIYQSQVVTSRVEVPIWILCLGGSGIVVGLATFGLNIMRLFGEKITRITPTRGFCAELATALVVSIASGYGIPISSTHSISGAIFALSMMDVGFLNVNWFLALKFYLGWVFTLVATGVVSAAFFAQGINAPVLSS